MARVALDESSFAENELEDGGSAASWAMMHPNSRTSGQNSSESSAPKKKQFVGSLSPPPQPDMVGEAVMPPSQLGESPQPGEYVLRVELRNFDGTFPSFPAETLSMTFPLSDFEAHCRRERENFKRQYLRAVKKFRRRRAKIQHEQMLQRIQAQARQQQGNLQLQTGNPLSPIPLCDVSNSAHVSSNTNTTSATNVKQWLDATFGKPAFDPTKPSQNCNSGTTGATAGANVSPVALGAKMYLQPPTPAFPSDLHSPIHTESLLTTIIAEIRLVVRRSLVQQLRARKAKVKRAQFNAIVEETTDSTFVQWQKEKEPLLRMSIRHYLQSANCILHRNIDRQLTILFDYPHP